MRRAMKQENSKQRNAAKREYSTTLRNLVKGIRSKDPRWEELLKHEERLNKQKEAIRKEQAKKLREEKEKQIQESLETANEH